jgi:hypothetical protein
VAGADPSDLIPSGELGDPGVHGILGGTGEENLSVSDEMTNLGKQLIPASDMTAHAGTESKDGYTGL